MSFKIHKIQDNRFHHFESKTQQQQKTQVQDTQNESNNVQFPAQTDYFAS